MPLSLEKKNTVPESEYFGNFQFPRLRSFFRNREQSLQKKLLRNAIEKHLDAPGTLLDIPSGDALVLTLLKNGPHTLHAVNSGLSETERQNLFLPGEARNVYFHTADSRKLPFPDDAFDYLVSRCFAQGFHASENSRTFEELARVTRNKLILFVRVRGFSPLRFLAGILFPDDLALPPASVKELADFLSQHPAVEILEICRAGWCDQGAVIAVLQKK